MYRVGFGDCFLVSFVADRADHVLVDCGVHVRGNLNKLDQVVADIQEITGGEVAAVVASHAHEDHIRGFGTHRAAFARMRIGEVWLPWSEDPTDDTAIGLRRKRAQLAAALVGYGRLSEEAKAVLDNAMALDGPAHDPLTGVEALAAVSRNEAALDALRTGFGTGARVRFLEAGDTVDEPAAGVPGLSVRVLGPPKDEAFLRRLDPPSAERFLRLGPDGAQDGDRGIRPFAKEWECDAPAGTFSPGDRQRLDQLAEPPGEALAFTLDQGLNNTSLVLLFSWRGRRLLFPGDAQWGGWQSWIDKPEAPELLRTVDFVKIAHHGSENATPRSALEHMSRGSLAAMVSTQQKPWPSIPYSKLYEAIVRQTHERVVRSDSIPVDVPDAPAGPPADPLPEGFAQGDLWFDWVVDAGAGPAGTPPE